MFQYRYPQFQKKRILRAEMLEDLRDYPKDFLQLSFEGFGNGIVTGCEVTWENDCLTVQKGILYYNGHLYFLKEPYQLECRPKDRVRYLKVQFLTEVVEVGQVSGTTRIVLEETEVDRACEMELCRFRLQQGARLRDRYEGFEDYSTRYDTIDRIDTPYAVFRGTTLAPSIFMQFAREMFQKGMTDMYDVSFAFQILANEGKIGLECIKEYLLARTKKQCSMENREVYESLLHILKQQRKETASIQRESASQKNILLL
ncbi:MAG TPA: hypothetical protein IAC14_01680 [Candidatus Scybalomonas excrementigallinarum]|nr:hypothetical protein [Candidatus Scybalomonas excrementigallinarum]